MDYISFIYDVLKRRIWQMLNKKKFIKLGFKSFIKNSLIITPNCISIGKNVFVQPNSRIEGIYSYEGICFSPKIVIADNCTIQQNLHLTCGESVYIGTNTAIAANVTITDITHPYENIHLPVEKQQIITNPVFIGDDCKIYNNVVVLPGTNIGKHCTIGANSVVNGSFPDYSVIVGIPSRIIKRYCFDSKKWKKTEPSGNFIN